MRDARVLDCLHHRCRRFVCHPWLVGSRIYQEAPPIADRVVTTEGVLVIGRARSARDRMSGRRWEHGSGIRLGPRSYVAPDWTADWLHREAEFILDEMAHSEYSLSYRALNGERQAALRSRLTTLMRQNTYDSQKNALFIPPVRARAFAANLTHYADIFTNGKPEYAIPRNASRPRETPAASIVLLLERLGRLHGPSR